MMALPSGLAAQAGFKTETTVGTAVTVDKFWPVLDPPAFTRQIEFMPVKGMYAGRRTQVAKKTGKQVVGGPLKLELNNKPMATVMTHLFGTVNTTGAGPYTHTASPGTLTAKSFTTQGGLPDISGTVQPFTWAGCKLKSATIAASMGQIATLDLDVFAMTENSTGTPTLTAATFLSGIVPFSFVEASITAGGSSLGVISDMSLTIDNALAASRFGLGSATAAEALEAGQRTYTGTINVEFLSMVAYNLYTAGTDFALVFTFNNGTDTLTITTAAYYGGAPITGSGGDILKQSLSFVCQHATADASAITAVLVNGESVAT